MTLLADAPPVVEPAHLTLPEGLSGAGQEAVDLAASAGLVLDGWQAATLDRALLERPDGRWAATEVGLVVPRQNGKGSVLEARELAGLFLFGDNLLIHTAHEFKTAMEAFRRLWGLVESTPDLARKVKRKLENNNGWTIELTTRQRILFIARSKGSGRGMSGDVVVFDEAYELPGKVVSALLPTMSARPNPQIWYTSSAPLEQEGSETLRRLCKRGRAGAPRLAYMEWCAADPGDNSDQLAWRAANPGIDAGRLSLEFVETELGAMEADDFARERLGIWREATGVQWLIPEESWRACENPGSKMSGPVAFAFDVAPDRGWASIAAAGASDLGGLVHVEVVESRKGTNWVVPRLRELQDRHGPLTIACDPGGPAGGLLAASVAAGVEIQSVSMREHAQACAGLLDGVLNGDVVQPGNSLLDAAVATAMKRDVGDVWLWSRKNSTVDITSLVAVTLAKWAWESADRDGEATASVW